MKGPAMGRNYATVSWEVETVRGARMKWSNERWEEFLEAHEDIIRKKMVMAGYRIISELLKRDKLMEGEI